MDEIEKQKFKSLLQKVSAISTKYEEIAKATGANYNVFNILGLSTREVRTHSAFIADLLNPNGLHGRGKVFLELFLKQLSGKLRDDDNGSHNDAIVKNNLVAEEATVIVEENIGKIDKDQGGRVDIVIKDKANQIVIENKIYAKDQYKQLVRYADKYSKASLIYLTLDEKEASDGSVTKEDGTKLEKNKDYFNITYKAEILNWLKFCHKETANKPLLRETLTQYINLIKQLTGQAMSDNMNEEVKKLIYKEEENAKAILYAYNSIKNDMKIQFNSITDELVKSNDLFQKSNSNNDIIIENCKEPQNGGGFIYFKYGISNNHNNKVWIQIVLRDIDFYFENYFEPNKCDADFKDKISKVFKDNNCIFNGKIDCKKDSHYEEIINKVVSLFIKQIELLLSVED